MQCFHSCIIFYSSSSVVISNYWGQLLLSKIFRTTKNLKPPICRWRNKIPERLWVFPKITQQIGGRTGTCHDASHRDVWLGWSSPTCPWGLLTPPWLICDNPNHWISLNIDASILGMIEFFWAHVHPFYTFLTSGWTIMSLKTPEGRLPTPRLSRGRKNVPPGSELCIEIPDKPP